MLFISIMLVLLFGLLILGVYFLNEGFDMVAAGFAELLGYDEDTDAAPNLKEGTQLYHLSCSNCKHDWWSTDSNVRFCPHCGRKQG